MSSQQFNEVITKLLGEKLKSFTDSGKSVNLLTCTQIYQTIFETLAEVFETSNANLCNESVNYLAQQYYDCILINENQELDPNIFTQRASLKNIETKELALLAVMLKGTQLAMPVIHEIKRRS